MIKKGLRDALISIAHIFWTVSAMMVFAVAIVGSSIYYLAPADLEVWFDSSLGSLLISALIYLAGALVVVIPFLIKKIGWKAIVERLGLTKSLKFEMFGWALFFWLIYFGVIIVVSVVLAYVHIPGFDINQKQNVGFSNMTFAYEYLAAFIALVVVAPIFEEIIFRGYLFGRLRERNSFWISAVLTSLVFGAVHLQLNVAIDVFILSMFMCYLRERFNSIWPTILMHSFKNGLAYVLLFVLPLMGINLG